jgi:hypothetical protein
VASLKYIVSVVLLLSTVAVGEGNRHNRAPGTRGKGEIGSSSGTPMRGRGSSGEYGQGKVRQLRCLNGDYTARVAGYYRGGGIAKVTDAYVSLDISLVAGDGQPGNLRAENLSCIGPYFSGEGLLLGKPVMVRGRLDAAKASRLTATFFVSGDRAGRIIAILPPTIDPGDEHWNDPGPGK